MENEKKMKIFYDEFKAVHCLLFGWSFTDELEIGLGLQLMDIERKYVNRFADH